MAAPSPTAQSQQPSNDLSLTVAGVAYSGWTSVRVSRSVEAVPPVFEIALTDRNPFDEGITIANEGDPCTVKIGGDLVITGYVDRVITSLSADQHEIKLIGRGKCADLVDCTCEWPSAQIKNSTVLQIAQKLAAPYGITVRALTDVGAVVPQFNVSVTDTPWSIIEEVCRYRGLLAFEDVDGALVLDIVGSTKAGSDIVQAQNVLEGAYTRAMDGRYSEVDAFLQAMSLLGPAGQSSNLLYRATDPNVPRHRRKAIIAEAPYGGQDVAKQRALWEVARRAGRSRDLRVTVDSWRDDAGKLWSPNTLVAIAMPAWQLAGVTWCIGQATYVRDEQGGTRCELQAMDPAGFKPEPILLAPVIRGVK